MPKIIDMFNMMEPRHPDQDDRDMAHTALLLACGPPPAQRNVFRSAAPESNPVFAKWERTALEYLWEQGDCVGLAGTDSNVKQIDDFIIWLGVQEMHKHVTESVITAQCNHTERSSDDE